LVETEIYFDHHFNPNSNNLNNNKVIILIINIDEFVDHHFNLDNNDNNNNNKLLSHIIDIDDGVNSDDSESDVTHH